MGFTVLSLCDGASCCHIALDKVGIKVDNYYAAEIKKEAIKVTQYNYPSTVQIGDVNKVSYKNGILSTENGNYNVGKIDLIAAGFPCQSESVAMNKAMRVGLEDKIRSGLFYECYRLFKEVNAKYFIFENVGGMKPGDKEEVSQMLGVEPIRINSKLVAPVLRDRLYWSNIPNITQPKKVDIKLNDILESGWSDREKARAILVSDSRPLTTPIRQFYRYFTTGFTTLIFKSEEHYRQCVAEYKRLTNGKKKMSAEDIDNYRGTCFDGVRYLTQNEAEILHGMPHEYTKCLSRNEAIGIVGDGWECNTIAHLFKGLTEHDDCKVKEVV